VGRGHALLLKDYNTCHTPLTDYDKYHALLADEMTHRLVPRLREIPAQRDEEVVERGGELRAVLTSAAAVPRAVIIAR
jgi:hypothetical protein